MFDEEYKNSPEYMGANHVTRTAIDTRMNELDEEFAKERQEMEQNANSHDDLIEKQRKGWSAAPLQAWRQMETDNPVDRIMEDILLPEQIEAERTVHAVRMAMPQPESVVQYDETGALLPPKKRPSTTREQTEYMNAIRKQFGQV